MPKTLEQKRADKAEKMRQWRAKQKSTQPSKKTASKKTISGFARVKHISTLVRHGVDAGWQHHEFVKEVESLNNRFTVPMQTRRLHLIGSAAHELYTDTCKATREYWQDVCATEYFDGSSIDKLPNDAPLFNL
jgi:predicted GTPase